MKKILALNGSMRKTGNTATLLNHFLAGAQNHTDHIEKIAAHETSLEYCRGCLRCNLLKHCSIQGDDWEDISRKILKADILVFASPVYFHHVSAQLKKIIDRFRSFAHVQITEKGLKHTPWQEWKKDFVLLASMGSSDDSDAQAVIDLFTFISTILGSGNRLHVIKCTRLAVVKQLEKTEDELEALYSKMQLPEHLAKEDFERNQKLLKQCYGLGNDLTK